MFNSFLGTIQHLINPHKSSRRTCNLGKMGFDWRCYQAVQDIGVWVTIAFARRKSTFPTDWYF